MTLRQDMLAIGRAGVPLLGDAAPRMAAFVNSLANPDGGFRGRSRASDLYYTAFALGCLNALGAALPPRLPDFLDGFGLGQGLDLVHAVCLANCLAHAGRDPGVERRRHLSGIILSHRSTDGGFHPTPGQAQGTAYAAFLAFGALQDLEQPLPDRESLRLLASLQALRTADGGYSNERSQAMGLTAITAGVVALQRCLGCKPDPSLTAWLLARALPSGGFSAGPLIPMADLLSTATALQALQLQGQEHRPLRNAVLRFLDTVWHESGAFCGHALDRHLDCEYTWYGLHCLGHVAHV